MFGKRRHAGASLHLRQPRALPPHMRGPIVELCDLATEPAMRRQGHANALMLAVTLEADLARTMLFLAVAPGFRDGPDVGQLALFYARHGFLPIQSEPLLMIRPYVAMRAAPRPLDDRAGLTA